MKKYIGILLVFTLLLTSCSIDWNDEKDKKITELEKQVTEIKKQKEDDLFKKKQECIKYKDEIEKSLEDKQQKSGKGKYSLEQIFYSLKKQGCYFVEINENEVNIERWLYEYGNHSWYSESVYACNYYYDEKMLKHDNGCNELDKKIKELKGE